MEQGKRELVFSARPMTFCISALIFCLFVTYTSAYPHELTTTDRIMSMAWNPLVRQSTTVTSKATWCVAMSSVDDSTLQAAIDYACGQTTADCNPIKLGQACFSPNTVVHHASYVFNSYYQVNAKGANTCSFGGVAVVTTEDPSYGSCIFPSSGSLNESTKVVQNAGSRMVLQSMQILPPIAYVLLHLV